MRCSACGGENPATAKFCSECGAALAAACAGCGHLNPRTSRFCSECGGPLAAPALEPHFASPEQYTPRPLADRIRADRPALEGEYKQVTVLFADVAGFTPIAERLNPEECYTLMRHCFDLMLEEVHRYEGTVTQFLGDGILALFGAPLAHEDHAQRAVRAALGIQQALITYQQELLESHGIVFRMRIGLNSGLVVVATIGTDLHMTYTAIGDTVNLGDRVRALAEPGSVVVSENTHRLVSGYFVTRALGEHQVKGKEQAVSAFEVLRPQRWRSRVDAHAERGLSPFVGRQSEWEILLDRAGRARTGQGQILFLRGEAGIGKSRLLFEGKRQMADQDWAWLEGRCISFGREIAYFPVIQLLKEQFEIEDRDAEAEIAAKVEAGVQALGAELLAHQPYLKYLLAVDPGEASVVTMDPQMRKAQLFEALRALLIAAAARRPLVITVEDLHWIDPLSEQFLLTLSEMAPRHPILLLLTARREYEPRFGSPAEFTMLDLQSLSAHESAAVVQGLLTAAEIPDELQELIHHKAEGNPFFVEEVTRSLLEMGVLRRSGSGYVLARRLEEIVVPDTVQDVIMTRLDRLPEEPKRALQTASVIGREFAVCLLERTTELEGRLAEYLRELEAVELIDERSLSPELAYMFKHALTQDVAYQSLLLARRKVLHRLVGAALEALYRDRLGEQYEALAYHYEQGEVWDKAVEYLQKSGDKALAAFAPQQAVSFYDRVLAAGAKSGQRFPLEKAVALHAGKGEALFLTNEWDRSADSFQAMVQAAQAAGDRVQEGMALFHLSNNYYFAHRFEDALDCAERAGRVAHEIDNPAVLAGSLIATALVCSALGDLQKLRVSVDEALQAARQAGSPLLQGHALSLAGLLDHLQGDDRRAHEQFKEALQIGRRHQSAKLLTSSLFLDGASLCGCGQYEPALQQLEECLALATQLGETFWRCRTLNTLGWVYMDLCHWDLAIHYNAQGAAESRAVGHPEIIRNAELNLGDCYLALGQLDDAQRYLETVEQESRRSGAWGEQFAKWRYSQRLHTSLGELWLARGDTEQALARADTCLVTATATGSRRNIVKSRRLKGAAFLAQGRLDAAEAELEAALQMAREVGNPAQLWKTLALMARLRQAQERPQDAAAALQEAMAMIDGIAADLSDPSLRAAFLSSPQVLGLREATARL